MKLSLPAFTALALALVCAAPAFAVSTSVLREVGTNGTMTSLTAKLGTQTGIGAGKASVKLKGKSEYDGVLTYKATGHGVCKRKTDGVVMSRKSVTSLVKTYRFRSTREFIAPPVLTKAISCQSSQTAVIQSVSVEGTIKLKGSPTTVPYSASATLPRATTPSTAH